MSRTHAPSSMSVLTDSCFISLKRFVRLFPLRFSRMTCNSLWSHYHERRSTTTPRLVFLYLFWKNNFHLDYTAFPFSCFWEAGFSSIAVSYIKNPDSGAPGTEFLIYPHGAISATILAIGFISRGRRGQYWQRTDWNFWKHCLLFSIPLPTFGVTKLTANQSLSLQMVGVGLFCIIVSECKVSECLDNFQTFTKLFAINF